jgi:hypothetical protein
MRALVSAIVAPRSTEHLDQLSVDQLSVDQLSVD